MKNSHNQLISILQLQKRDRFYTSFCAGLIWFVEFYVLSTLVGYLMPNPFLCKYSVLFQTIQFNSQKHFYFKLFKQLYVTIQLRENTVLMSKKFYFK